jgi:hypothetical protein
LCDRAVAIEEISEILKSKKPSDLLDGFFLLGRRQPLIDAAAHFSAVRTHWGLILGFALNAVLFFDPFEQNAIM